MRKHFLILMLLTLLPLAGWAQAQVDISDGWEISITNPTYTGSQITPTVTLKKGDEVLSSGNFNVSFADEERINCTTSGYAVTVTCDLVHTVGELEVPTKKFYILMAQSAVQNASAIRLANDAAWDGQPHSLVSVAPTVNFGTIEYSTDQQTWSTNLPTATKVGDYHVYYRVQQGNNWLGIPSTLFDDTTDDNDLVKITGNSLTDNDYTAPTAFPNNLTYTGSDQPLIEAGSVVAAGNAQEIQYKLGNDGPWKNTVPQAKDKGDYTVFWKVVAKDGYYDKVDNGGLNPEPLKFEVSIGKATATITNGAGATNLTYDATQENRSLLTSAAIVKIGTTEVNASSDVKYDVTYAAYTSNTEFGNNENFLTGVAYNAVKATNAGKYIITAKIAGANNFNDVSSETVEVIIGKANAFTAAPTAKSVRWTGDTNVQELINGATNPVAGAVLYSMEANTTNSTPAIDWTTNAADIKAAMKGVYTVKYKVKNNNYMDYVADGTAIANVEIKGALLSVIVNSVTKVYDGTTTLTDENNTTDPVTPANYVVDGGKDKFTFVTTVSGYNTTNIAYAAINTSNKNVGTHDEVVTITDAFANDNPNWDITVFPGNLTVTAKRLTVTVNAQNLLTKTLTQAQNFDFSGQYTVDGIVNAEDVWAENKAPKLKANLPEKLHPGSYDLSWTYGELAENSNYTISNEDYVIGDVKYEITADQNSQVLVSILPIKKTYGQDDAEVIPATPVKGTDYVVTGLVGDDDIESITISRSNTDKQDVNTYDLTATVTLKKPGYYDLPVEVIGSTFTIEAKELEAVVETQTLKVGDATADLAQTAWSIKAATPLAYNETIDDLGGSLTLADNVTIDGNIGQTVDDAITLAITNGNYKLKTGSDKGKVIVVSAATLTLDASKADNVAKLNAIKGTNVPVQIALNRGNNGYTSSTYGEVNDEWRKGEWNPLMLPFAITVGDLSQKLGYAIINVVDPNKAKVEGGYAIFGFKLEMGFDDEEIPANTPIMVKTNKDLADIYNASGYVVFGNQYIPNETFTTVYETPADKNGWGWTYCGTYEEEEINKTKSDYQFFIGNDETPLTNAKFSSSSTKTFNVVPFSAYVKAPLPVGAREILFTFEELDGTTSIMGVTAEGKLVNAEGWYTLNGVKLQGIPTQKGIYINNGKKIVIK